MAAWISSNRPGKPGVVLQGLELGPRRRGLSSLDLGAAQRASHPEVGEQLRGAFAGHGRPAVGVQGEDLVLFVTLFPLEPHGI